MAHQRAIVDAAGKDSWMIAETAVAEEMLQIAGVIVADSEAFDGHSLLGRVGLDLDLLVTMEPVAAEHFRGF